MSDDFFETPSREGEAGGREGRGKGFWRRWHRSSGSGGEEDGGRRRARLWRWSKRLALLLLLIALLYYPLGALMVHEINDDLAFAPEAAGAVPPGASRAVAMAAALIDREVNHTAWPGNDPWFFPGVILDNMPNFQAGEIQALQIFSIELRDQIGRARGTSAADPDLQDAAGALSPKPDIWYIDFSRSWLPLTPSDSWYRDAMRKLVSYNARLARGEATFERRADNLLALLERIGKDIGAASNDLDEAIALRSGDWIDWTADDLFYRDKGRLYAYAVLLRELGADFQPILAEKGATKVWQRMIDSLSDAARLRPLVIINGAPSALLQPNHLATQGFYILRARASIEEVGDILQK